MRLRVSSMHERCVHDRTRVQAGERAQGLSVEAFGNASDIVKPITFHPLCCTSRHISPILLKLTLAAVMQLHHGNKGTSD